MKTIWITLLITISFSISEARSPSEWRTLFDGRTTSHWRGAFQDKFPAGWVVENGCLKNLGKDSPQPGDLITREEFENFELELEWKIMEGGNSGIKYLVVEHPERRKVTALEMQILDDDRHPDANRGKDGNRKTGSLYDLLPARNKVLKPVGQFNHARLVVRGDHVEHWLNGVKVLEFNRRSPEFKNLISSSKFKNIPDFGKTRKGHIILQDHRDVVWFRNIRIRELK
jgi:hypothetical protein